MMMIMLDDRFWSTSAFNTHNINTTQQLEQKKNENKKWKYEDEM